MGQSQQQARHTNSGRICQFSLSNLGPDIADQARQPQTGHSDGNQIVSNQTSKLRRPLTDPDRKASSRASKSRQDIPASGWTCSQRSELRRDRLELPIPDGQDTPLWIFQFPNLPPQTRPHQMRHPSSNWGGTASDLSLIHI